MAVPHSLHPEAGSVRIDDSTCTHCGQCARICPAKVLSLDDGHIRVRADSHFGCIACGHCMMVCPQGSVTVSGRGLSPDDLATLPPLEQRATAEALTALLLARRSIRHFKEVDVAPELLERVVGMAAAAPMGIPPWDVGCVVVQDRTRVRELAGDIIRGYEGFLRLFRPWVLAAMRPFVRRATYAQFHDFIRPLAMEYVEAWRQGKDRLFYGAPAVMIFHRSPYADNADAVIACTYAMLAAESLGLGTTMIGAAAPIIQRDKALCRKLRIPDGNTPALALILGYPAVSFRHAVRRRFTSVERIG